MVRDAPSSEDLESYRGEQLAERIDALRPEPPTIGPMAMGRIDDQQGERRQIGPGHTIPTNRWYARYKVDGDLRLLERWPDADDLGLRTVDHELMERIGGYDALRTASRSDVTEYWRLSKTWTLETVELPGPWALYTYFDLTADEEKQHASDGTMSDLINPRYERMIAIVEAIAEQTNRYFNVVLPQRVADLVADRTEVHANRQAIVAGLDLGEDWVRQQPVETITSEHHPDSAVETETPAETHVSANGQPASTDGADAQTANVEGSTAFSGIGDAADALATPQSPAIQQTPTSVAAVQGGSVHVSGDVNFIYNGYKAGAHTGSQVQVAGTSVHSSGTKRQPNWLILMLLPIVIGLALTWLGFNEWRVPWVDKPSTKGADSSAADSDGATTSDSPPTSPSDETTGPGTSTSPIVIDVLKSGGVDVSWSIVDDPQLRGYDVFVSAVRPIKYEYAEPRYPGDTNVSTRIYPTRYLRDLLREAGDARKVRPGQVWHVCVVGMKETPLNEPIDDYIIPGTRACSSDFRIP